MLPSETELQQRFAKQHSWQDRYRQIILLAKCLPSLPETDKQPQYLIQGCENRVWLLAKQAAGKLQLLGDSDGRIVKGLLAILLILAQDKTPSQILAIDFQQQLQQLHIAHELSQSKQVGITNIIKTLRQLAQQALET